MVVFSGWAPAGGTPEAEQMRALWDGPDIELSLEMTASTTAENAARTFPLVSERGIRRAVVVCTPLHLYRARWFFVQAAGDLAFYALRFAGDEDAQKRAESALDLYPGGSLVVGLSR